MNTSALGDVLISSLLLEYQGAFDHYSSIYFLFPSEYVSLFENYTGRVKLIPFDKRKYKWFLNYRFSLLKRLHKLKLKDCINLNSSRGISADEITLLSGAQKKYCLINLWTKNIKYFSSMVDSRYDIIFNFRTRNEYERHLLLFSYFDNKISSFKTKTGSIFEGIAYGDKNFEDYLVIAPLASNSEKQWSYKNYIRLCENIPKKYRIYFVGTDKEKKIIDKYCLTDQTINYSGRLTLKEMASMIANSKLFIGNDSGLLHLSLRLKNPSLGIIGGGTFGWYLPFTFSDGAKDKFLFSNLDCFGCEWKCLLIEKKCLTDISVDIVFKAAMELIQSHENS